MSDQWAHREPTEEDERIMPCQEPDPDIRRRRMRAEDCNIGRAIWGPMEGEITEKCAICGDRAHIDLLSGGLRCIKCWKTDRQPRRSRRDDPRIFFIRGLQILAILAAIVLVSFHLGVYKGQSYIQECEPSLQQMCPGYSPAFSMINGENGTFVEIPIPDIDIPSEIGIYPCNISYNENLPEETLQRCFYWELR